MAAANRLLPGLGELSSVRLNEDSAAVGQSLADLQLRAITGASVLSITRGEVNMLAPSSKVVLKPGDLLVLTGSTDAVQSAKRALIGAE